MRALSAVVLLCALGTACDAGPTEREINNSLEETLRSVSGEWIGLSPGSEAIRLDFRLQEGSNGQVSGSGTMKEGGVASTVPITVTGTFQRPLLSLTFTGITYAGRSVQGTAAGNYTTVGGILTALQLTGTGYSQSLQMLLQEK